jgi:hypothetical protein
MNLREMHFEGFAADEEPPVVRAQTTSRAERPGTDGQAGKPLPCMTPAAWAKREIEPQDLLLGEMFSTSTRALFAADTGLGKTMFALALAIRLRLGTGFLHWKGRREARVLYLDGEMPTDLIRDRIVQECARAGVDAASITDGLYILSREDVEGMPPLDTPEGAEWLGTLLDMLKAPDGKGIDFVVFDNLMCLTVGDLREETTWAGLKPLVLALTKRRVGQFWLHHVGHDKTRPYGSKTFQWMMDLVMLGEAVTGHEDADVAFKLSFQKRRRRTPDNRHDFEDATVTLRDGRWASGAVTPGKASTGKLSPRAASCLDALERAVNQAGEKPPHHEATRHVTRAVKVTMWRQYFEQITAYEKGSSSLRQAWSVGTQELLKPGGKAVKWGEWVWLALDRHTVTPRHSVTSCDARDGTKASRHVTAPLGAVTRDAVTVMGCDGALPPFEAMMGGGL